MSFSIGFLMHQQPLTIPSQLNEIASEVTKH